MGGREKHNHNGRGAVGGSGHSNSHSSCNDSDNINLMSMLSSDFGLRGPKPTWACPNDRHLALRGKYVRIQLSLLA